MLDSVLGERAAASFTVRDVAPDVLLFGNIGLSQLTKDALPDIVAALDRVGANALAVHTNPLQEAMQHRGDTWFAGSLDRLHDLADVLGYPVLLKEVGHGIGAAAVGELLRLSGEPPVAAIDVAGAGGTSQARVSALDVQVALTNAQASSGDNFVVASNRPLAATSSPIAALRPRYRPRNDSSAAPSGRSPPSARTNSLTNSASRYLIVV